MGWNSWDCYGTAVREEDVRANADFMAGRLARFGWSYIVVDIQWYQGQAQGHAYDPQAKPCLDDYGRLIPAPNRFPSGFKALADYVHGLGLKFGIHIMRGIPREALRLNLPIKSSAYRAADIAETDNACRWNPDMYGIDCAMPGAQDYYDSIAELYASWGVDFIKADDMGSHLYQPMEIRALRRALDKTGRPMLLSISPGPACVQEAAFFRRYADMWRISDDFWDDWGLLRRQFDYALEWQGELGQGGWPDADMLAIGRLRMAANGGQGEDSRFSPDEQRTMLSLWSIMRSPLIMGGDLPRSPDYAISLLSNEEVIAVNQSSRNNRQALDADGARVWLADAPESEPGKGYLAAFNLSDRPLRLRSSWADLGLAGRRYALRDLWERAELGSQARLSLRLAPHSSALLSLRVEGE